MYKGKRRKKMGLTRSTDLPKKKTKTKKSFRPLSESLKRFTISRKVVGLRQSTDLYSFKKKGRSTDLDFIYIYEGNEQKNHGVG